MGPSSAEFPNLQENVTAPLAILLLAARRGEDLVEGAIRFLLGSRQVLSAEQTARLIEENTPAPLSAITIDPVCLSIFDELLTREDPAA